VELEQHQIAVEEMAKLERIIPANEALTRLKKKCFYALNEFQLAERLERQTPDVAAKVHLIEVV
jgi:hypothetical protein